MNDPNFLFFDIVLPVGAITPFAGNVSSIKNSSPSSNPIESYGWMVCDGSSISAYKYPELYAVLGDLYGTTGSGNDLCFNLPDLRGQFLRGIGFSKDTDNASLKNRIDASLEDRSAAPGGTPSGVGSTQTDALQTHEHTYTEPAGSPAPGESSEGTASVNTKAETSIPIDTPNEHAVKVSIYETRATNTFVNYLIKYTYQLPKYSHLPNVL